MFLVCQLETNVCFGQHQSASYFESLMGMVVLRLVHLSCSLGHASQSDHIFHYHPWMVPINELLQCSRERIRKFSYLQKKCVSVLCVGMFVAMLTKENISFPVVKSAKLLLHSPHSL